MESEKGNKKKNTKARSSGKQSGAKGKSAAGGGRPRKRISPLEDEIRKRYEAGEDLIELAREYMIPYGSLRGISSKNKWEKGKTKDLIYNEEHLRIVKAETEKRKRIIEEYRKIQAEIKSVILSDLENLDPDPDRMMKVSQYFINTSKSIEVLFKTDRELYHILTDLEEIEYKKKLAEYEKWKAEYEEKDGESIKIG